jgi:hypothetical protein
VEVHALPLKPVVLFRVTSPPAPESVVFRNGETPAVQTHVEDAVTLPKAQMVQGAWRLFLQVNLTIRPTISSTIIIEYYYLLPPNY